MKKRKALVTGGAGFLGSHVCRRLLAEAMEVVCLDNLQTGRLTNIDPLQKDPNFSFVQGDVKGMLPDQDFDEIWNLACPASPPHYQRDPVDTMMTNVIGMKNVLDLAVKTGARVFQASTSEVYGDPEIHPQTEAYRGAVSTTGPRACYDEGKRAAETLCFDYHRMHGVEIKVVRIFNTYGPHMDPGDGRVVSNFIVNALRGEPLELYGDGAQTRSFCYVDDLIDGFFHMMRSDASITGPVNLGNPGEVTILELAELVIVLTGSSSRIVHGPLPKDDPLQRCPDITLAQSLFGWSPKVPLREGLMRCIPWFAAEAGVAPDQPLKLTGPGSEAFASRIEIEERTMRKGKLALVIERRNPSAGNVRDPIDDRSELHHHHGQPAFPAGAPFVAGHFSDSHLPAAQ